MRPPAPLYRRQRRKPQIQRQVTGSDTPAPPAGHKQTRPLIRRVLPPPGGARGPAPHRKNRKQISHVDNEHHVIPRPDPDDDIHSDHDDREVQYTDEDNHPQDYYDPDDDTQDEGPEHYDAFRTHHLDPQKLALNPKFRRNLPAHNLDQFNRRENKGDEEYEQYIDDNEEDGGQDQGQPRIRPLDLIHPKHLALSYKNKMVNHILPANQDEDSYNYYDNEDGAEGVNGRRGGKIHMGGRSKMVAPMRRLDRRVDRSDRSIVSVAEPVHHSKPPLHTGVRPPGKAYMVLFAIMVLLLFFMYRFVKKRRIVIRYHRNTCR